MVFFIVVLLLFIMFLGIFGSNSVPILVALLAVGSIYYGINKVNNSNIKNKKLEIGRASCRERV